MDTEKLLKVLNDIVQEEQTNSIVEVLINISSQITANTTEAFAQVTELRQKMTEILNKSPIKIYPPSYQAILEAIGGGKFYGGHAINTIDQIFNSGPLGLADKLNQYRAEYQAFVKKSQQSKESLEQLSIKPYANDSFEIGYIMPAEIDNLQSITDHLGYWDRFICTCSQIAGEKEHVVQVSRMSNGSWEVFIASTVAVAKIVDIVLDHLLKLYDKVQKIKKIYDDIQSLGDDTKQDGEEALKSLGQMEENLKVIYIERTTTEVMTLYKGVADEKERLSNDFAVYLKKVLKDTEEGVKHEVSPPAILGQDENIPAETVNVTEKLAMRSVKLKELYSLPLEQRKLPFKVDVTQTELDKIGKQPKKVPTKKDAKSVKKIAKKKSSENGEK